MRVLKNLAERAFQITAENDGWKVSKRGWPDFFCVKGEKIMLVEVKKKPTHSLKLEQRRVTEALAKFGVSCFKWTPEGGFEQIPLAGSTFRKLPKETV